MPPFARFGGAFCPHSLDSPIHLSLSLLHPDYEPQRNRSKVAEEMDYEAAGGDSVISEQDEVDIPPETNELSEDGAEIAENVMLDADVMVKETTE